MSFNQLQNKKKWIEITALTYIRNKKFDKKHLASAISQTYDLDKTKMLKASGWWYIISHGIDFDIRQKTNLNLTTSAGFLIQYLHELTLYQKIAVFWFKDRKEKEQKLIKHFPTRVATTT